MSQYFERLAALILLGVWAPILVMCMVVIRLTSPGPAIYTQVRRGQNQKKFCVYKLRSMIVSQNEASVRSATDPRITACGHFLRKSRLDELPQLWNIVRGEMTFVGPRPHNEEDHTRHTIRFGRRYTNRYLSKPGIYGVAQLCWRREDNYRRLVACDELFRIRRSRKFCLKVVLASCFVPWLGGGTF